jgi:hypothetical protein
MATTANAQPGAWVDPSTVETAQPSAGAAVADVGAPFEPPGAMPARRSGSVVAHRTPTKGQETTRRWAFGARLTGLSGIGALPGVNYGAELATYVRHDEMFAELAFGWWRPEHEHIVTTTPEPVKLGMDVWTLRVGRSSMATPLRAWLLIEGGEIAGAKGMPGVMARMVTGDTPTERRWQAAGAGFGVAWPIADTARLFGMIEFAVPFNGGNVMVGQEAYESEALAARSSVGIELGWR